MESVAVNNEVLFRFISEYRNTDEPVDLLKKLSRQHENPDDPVRQIERIVEEIFGISAQEYQVKSRKRDLVIPRQMKAFLLRRFTNFSLARIGMEIGNRDHATVIHSSKAIANLLEVPFPPYSEMCQMALDRACNVFYCRA